MSRPAVASASANTLAPRLERARERERTVSLLMAALAAVYLGFLVSRLPDLIGSIGWASDPASPLVLTEALASGGTSGHVLLGTAGYYNALWFGLLTHGLPFHRQLWEVAPVVLGLMSASLMTWTVTRVEGRRAGAIAGLLALALGPDALRIVMRGAAHNSTYVTTILLGALLVWFTTARPMSRRTRWLVVAVAGLIVGTSVASDAMLIVDGLVPFALTALLLPVILRTEASRRAGAQATGVLVIATISAVLTTLLMGAAGFSVVSPPAGLASIGTLATHWRWLVTALLHLLGVLPADRVVAVPWVVAGTLACLTGMLVLARRHGMPARLCSRKRVDESAARRAAHLGFWGLAAGLSAASFAFSTLANPFADSYLLICLYAAAATVPLLARRWPVPVLATTVAVALLGIVPLGDGQQWPDPQPQLRTVASEIVAVINSEHASVGYGSWGDSDSLTWSTQGRLKIYPVRPCPLAARLRLCPFGLMSPASWYRPRPGVRSYLLVDRHYEWQGTSPATVPLDLGRPIDTRHIGTLLLEVYPYDIAQRLVPLAQAGHSPAR